MQELGDDINLLNSDSLEWPRFDLWFVVIEKHRRSNAPWARGGSNSPNRLFFNRHSHCRWTDGYIPWKRGSGGRSCWSAQQRNTTDVALLNSEAALHPPQALRSPSDFLRSCLLLVNGCDSCSRPFRGVQLHKSLMFQWRFPCFHPLPENFLPADRGATVETRSSLTSSKSLNTPLCISALDERISCAHWHLLKETPSSCGFGVASWLLHSPDPQR